MYKIAVLNSEKERNFLPNHVTGDSMEDFRSAAGYEENWGNSPSRSGDF